MCLTRNYAPPGIQTLFLILWMGTQRVSDWKLFSSQSFSSLITESRLGDDLVGIFQKLPRNNIKPHETREDGSAAHLYKKRHTLDVLQKAVPGGGWVWGPHGFTLGSSAWRGRGARRRPTVTCTVLQVIPTLTNALCY